MKKIWNITLTIMLVLVFCSASTPNAKINDNNIDINLAIIPYLKVLEKLSNEYGVELYVSEENKEKFYYGVSKMTPRQFEAQQRQQYKEALKDIHETTTFYDTAEEGSTYPYPSPIPNADKMIPAILIK